MRKTRFTIFTAALALAVLFVCAAAQAQTPAGTTIRNQASARFQDLSGNSYTATSNEVTTIVLPVFGVSILPDDSGETPPLVPAMMQNAIPGQTIYYSYNLTNTGNDADTYALLPLLDAANTTMTLGLGSITIYNDVNGNGVLDGGEPAISSGGAPGNLGPIAAGATVNILVSYQVPPAALAGEVAYVGVQATSAGDPTRIDTRNYHLTTVVSDASLTAAMSGLPANVDPGNVDHLRDQRLQRGHPGRARRNGRVRRPHGRLHVRRASDRSDDGSSARPFRRPLGLAGRRNGPVLARGKRHGRLPGDVGVAAVADAGDLAVAYVTNGGLAVGQFYNFTYDLVVPSTMRAGIINNSGAVAYVDNNPGTPNPTIVTTNNTQITVNAIANVLVGPAGQPAAGTPPNYNDDVQAVPLAYANTTVSFTNTVRNDGNAVDAINITLDARVDHPRRMERSLLPERRRHAAHRYRNGRHSRRRFAQPGRDERLHRAHHHPGRRRAPAARMTRSSARTRRTPPPSST